MRVAGIILLVLGIAGTINYGIQAFQESESFQIFGLDIAVSSANWLPVIVSVIVLLIGVILISRSKLRKNKR